MMKKLFLLFLFPVFLISYDDYHPDVLRKLLDDIAMDYVEEFPSEKIIRKGDMLWCTGDSPAAKASNSAYDLMMEGHFDKAAVFLEKCLKKSPLFIPFRHNLSICYYHIRNFPRAHLNIDKAIQQVPQYYFFYIQKGIIYDLSFQYEKALFYYKKAARLNTIDTEPLVIIGDLYFSRGRHSMAEKYYNIAVKKEPDNPNALLGISKIYFSRDKIYLSYMTMKKINKTKDFDKSYYYYFAEAAYKLRRYRESYASYIELMKYRYDKFFITTSFSLIEYKADLARKFAEAEEELNSN